MKLLDNALAIAAWESETVLNLGPHLDATNADRVWTAVLAHRDSADVEAFATVARAIGIAVTPDVRARLELAIAALTVIHAVAAPPAQE